MNLHALKEPFPAGDIEWRLQSSGKKGERIWARCLAYVTNRAIMNRLDDCVGPENWRNEYAPAPCGGIMCGLSIRVDGEWITKWDGAENTDIEGVKGGLSGAMKRAGVQWGIGRYLYLLEEGFAVVHDGGVFRGRLKKEEGGTAFKWDPPALPAFALPGATAPEPKVPPAIELLPHQRCTAGQVKLIENLLKSHVFTDAERSPIREKIAANLMTKDRAKDAIDWLTSELADRKAIEQSDQRESA